MAGTEAIDKIFEPGAFPNIVQNVQFQLLIVGNVPLNQFLLVWIKSTTPENHRYKIFAIRVHHPNSNILASPKFQHQVAVRWRNEIVPVEFQL